MSLNSGYDHPAVFRKVFHKRHQEPGTSDPMDYEHDRYEKFDNAQIAGIRPAQVLPASKNNDKPHNPQKPEHTQNQNQRDTVNLYIIKKEKKNIQGKIGNQVDDKDALQIMAYGKIFFCDFNSLVPVGGEKVQQDIDQKKEINEVNDFGTEFVSRVPKSDLIRYQPAAYQDKN